ncbi:hypothetical protein Cdeb_02261 [Caldibacillus debilis GB1]|uniref:Uncharacterized protein n=2 Tax=Caldibacillus debilis TaxID=301148 RepID=A0A420VBC4_9BACI|nr:hypothetical protein Cdeb_02261 [Caldibacillus debilis GB1]
MSDVHKKHEKGHGFLLPSPEREEIHGPLYLHDELASEKTRARGRYAAEQVPSEPQAAGGSPRKEVEKQYRMHHSTKK